MAGRDSGGKGRAIEFDDASLARSAAKGDMQAFASLVAKYQDRVFNMVFRMCGHREDAEELAQEAFLRALDKISQFRGQSLFYTWLFRIAANLVISHRRRAGRIKFESLALADDFVPGQAASLSVGGRAEKSPPAAVAAAEASERVLLALNELDDEMRLAVILRDVEDMEYSQMAEVIGVPVGTVKSRLHRARCALRGKLADLID